MDSSYFYLLGLEYCDWLLQGWPNKPCFPLSTLLCSFCQCYSGHVTCFGLLLIVNKWDAKRGFTCASRLVKLLTHRIWTNTFSSCLKALNFGIVYHAARYDGYRWNIAWLSLLILKYILVILIIHDQIISTSISGHIWLWDVHEKG